MLVLGISFIMSVRLLIFIILLYSFVDTVPLKLSKEGWRNGSASASRAEGWVFESLTLHFAIFSQ